jgi:hypothetical protein
MGGPPGSTPQSTYCLAGRVNPGARQWFYGDTITIRPPGTTSKSLGRVIEARAGQALGLTG